ncbi:SRPBCC family protein [Halomarina litorea]|uniref:SRPBCC family protein n=1 Tax=Halomarina litorea TaxID=2961595 RepID=UPI0020C43A1D|nr:SRPBCC family protein [Halomarina sp. BCD28]
MSTTLARTPDGYRIEVGRRVGASTEACWEVLIDTHRWPEWGPSVRAVECDDGERYIQYGTRGRVQLALTGGPWAPFEVTACADYRWTWRVGVPAGDAMRNVLDAAPRVPATGHRVEPLGANACRVVFEVPPLAAGYVPVCRRALDRIEELAVGAQAGDER